MSLPIQQDGRIVFCQKMQKKKKRKKKKRKKRNHIFLMYKVVQS